MHVHSRDSELTMHYPQASLHQLLVLILSAASLSRVAGLYDVGHIVLYPASYVRLSAGISWFLACTGSSC